MMKDKRYLSIVPRARSSLFGDRTIGSGIERSVGYSTVKFALLPLLLIVIGVAFCSNNKTTHLFESHGGVS